MIRSLWFITTLWLVNRSFSLNSLKGAVNNDLLLLTTCFQLRRCSHVIFIGTWLIKSSSGVSSVYSSHRPRLVSHYRSALLWGLIKLLLIRLEKVFGLVKEIRRCITFSSWQWLQILIVIQVLGLWTSWWFLQLLSSHLSSFPSHSLSLFHLHDFLHNTELHQIMYLFLI